MMRTPTLLTAAACFAALPVLAHEGGGDGEHLNVGFYYGHDGTFEAPANPPEPATLLVDTHPWELDTVFYTLDPSEAPLPGWSGEFPGFRTLLVEDEELGGHGYYSWLNESRGVDIPDLRLHLVEKDDELTILDPGTLADIGDTHIIGTNTANHHLIYYVDAATGAEIGDVFTATYYLTDANAGLAQSQNFTVQFVVERLMLPGDTDGDGDVDDADLGTSFANYTGVLSPGTGDKTAAQGDTDGDTDVDDADLGTSFAAYTGALTPASVPEPASAALLALGGLALVRRRLK